MTLASPSGTIWRVALAPRAAGRSIAETQQHWATGHGDLALGLPGMTGYVQHHAALRDGRPLLPYAGFDVCAFTAWASLETMDAAFTTSRYTEKIRTDELALLDQSRLTHILAEQMVLIDGDPGESAFALLSFFSARRGTDRQPLIELLATEWARVAAGTGPLAHEQLIAHPEWHGDEQPPCCDAIDVLWYPSADATESAALGELSMHGGWLLAGHAFGTERLISRPARRR